MAAPQKIQKPYKITNHLIAEFKAKYSVSNIVMCHLLDVPMNEFLRDINSDSFTVTQNMLVNRVDKIIQHMIEESKVAGKAPYLVKIEHEKEMQELEIKRMSVSNDELNKEIKLYKTMSFFQRVLFLLNIR